MACAYMAASGTGSRIIIDNVAHDGISKNALLSKNGIYQEKCGRFYFIIQSYSNWLCISPLEENIKGETSSKQTTEKSCNSSLEKQTTKLKCNSSVISVVCPSIIYTV